MVYPFIKHFLDRIFALTLLIALTPLFFFISLLLYIQNNGSPFFTQVRPGKNAQLFTIFKFKTMRDTRDAEGNLLPDFDRITPLGKTIRKLSLDELPQLWNVLLGQMSFVGPRPLLPEYLSLYSTEQQKRHLVKPGITGWAQVNGRNTLSWKEKFALDCYYVEKQGFFLDLKILFLTLYKLIVPKDINAGSQTTMEPFNGKN
ncbi:sugar transferase [Flavobacteriaceae bacterium]|nr:sugar transferase [Flavobacteriaceae bacterium]MDB9823838.1 sugar transferase [Flavobacteriaceae bacterium]